MCLGPGRDAWTAISRVTYGVEKGYLIRKLKISPARYLGVHRPMILMRGLGYAGWWITSMQIKLVHR
jgi:hypothetical protein